MSAAAPRPVVKRPAGDKEYRPETERDRKRAELSKELNETNLLLDRVIKKFARIKELALDTLT